MTISSFFGKDLRDAMRQAQAVLGEQALIVSEKFTEHGVEIIASVEKINVENEVSEIISDGVDIREILRWQRIPEELVGELTAHPLEIALKKIARFGKFNFSRGKTPLAIVGSAGSGKTLSVAKLASRLVLSENLPLVITTDAERAAGVEQLAAHTRQLGIPLVVARNRSALLEAIGHRKMGQPVLIDTAPVDLCDQDAMAVLVELKAATKAQLCVALPAGYDSEETADLAEFFCKSGANMMIATRLDQARRIGNIVTAAACGLVITEAGISDSGTGGLIQLTADRLAAGLLKKGFERNWVA